MYTLNILFILHTHKIYKVRSITPLQFKLTEKYSSGDQNGWQCPYWCCNFFAFPEGGRTNQSQSSRCPGKWPSAACPLQTTSTQTYWTACTPWAASETKTNYWKTCSQMSEWMEGWERGAMKTKRIMVARFGEWKGVSEERKIKDQAAGGGWTVCWKMEK